MRFGSVRGCDGRLGEAAELARFILRRSLQGKFNSPSKGVTEGEDDSTRDKMYTIGTRAEDPALLRWFYGIDGKARNEFRDKYG